MEKDKLQTNHIEKTAMPLDAKQIGSSKDGIVADMSLQHSESHNSIQNEETVEMTKNLSPWALIAIAFNVCNSWAGLAGSMDVALSQGGPVSLVYGFLISSSLYGCIALTMAELASVYPTAGGQYHFVSILAPSRFYRSLSYTCGMITNFSWIAIGAAINMIFSEELMTLIMFYHPNFVSHPWHLFLFYESFSLVILLYNILALKKLSVTHYIGFFLCISVFFCSFFATLIRSSPKAALGFVWTTFINETGWPDGVCFIASLLTTCFVYSGLDASLHLAEEAPNPRIAVPRACVSAVVIGFLTAFAYLITMLYSIVAASLLHLQVPHLLGAQPPQTL